MPKHPVFTPPDDPNVRIWRYMDFTKFVAMLENRGLFFPRADMLGDPFEGSMSKANLELRANIYGDEIPPKAWKQLSEEMRRGITCTWINCWHMNEHESAGMWQLYANANRDEAIAVQSTFARLESVFDKYQDVYVGIVHYIDYEKDWMAEGNMMYPFVHKRKAYEHEREVRAVIYDMHRMEDNEPLPLVSPQHPMVRVDPETMQVTPITSIYDLPDVEGYLAMRNAPPPTPRGEWREVDLGILIEAIYVAPSARTWFTELVGRLCARYQLNKDVIQSRLKGDPIYG